MPKTPTSTNSNPQTKISSTQANTNITKDNNNQQNTSPTPKTSIFNQFNDYLKNSRLSASTIRNYQNDVEQFFAWFNQYESGIDISVFTPKIISAYQQYLQYELNMAPTTIDRKLASLKKFFTWAVDEGLFISSPFTKAKIKRKGDDIIVPTKLGEKSKFVQFIKDYDFIVFPVIAILLFLLGILRPWRIFFPSQEDQIAEAIKKELESNEIYNSNPANANAAHQQDWYVNFYAQIKDNTGNPVITQSDITFKLYASKDSNTPVWTSKEWELTPDPQGYFFVKLGDSDRGDISIPSELFFQNEELFLAPYINGLEFSPRTRISTAHTASNSYMLDGVTASELPKANQIPIINSLGEIAINHDSAKVKNSNGNLGIEGTAVTITTPYNSSENITLSPQGGGGVEIIGSNTSSSTFSIRNSQLISGGLISAALESNETGVNLIDLQAGIVPTTKFKVDSEGNTIISGKLSGASELTLADTRVQTTLSDASNYSLPANATSIYGAINEAYTIAQSTLTASPSAVYDSIYWEKSSNYVKTKNAESVRIYGSNSNSYLDIAHNNTDVLFTSSGTGKIDIDSNLTVQDDLNVSQGATITQNLTVNGNILNGSGDNVTIDDNLILSDGSVFAIGGNTSSLSYNKISNSGTSDEGLSSDNDLYIEGEFEVDGNIYLGDSDSNSNITFSTGSGDVIFDDLLNCILSTDASGAVECMSSIPGGNSWDVFADRIVGSFTTGYVSDSDRSDEIITFWNNGSLGIGTTVDPGAYNILTTGGLTASTLTDGSLNIIGGIIDLGTNSLSDGNLAGDWDFNSGDLTGIDSLTANTLTSSVALNIDGTLRDKDGQAGTSSQILSSTGTGIDWIDVSSIGIGGSGTTGYLPLWSTSSVLTNSSLFETGSNIGIGLTNPSTMLEIAGGITTQTLTDGTLTIRSGIIDLGTNTIYDTDFTGNWTFNSGNLSGLGTLDLGTNTILDGNFTGDWAFNSGDLSGIDEITLNTLTSTVTLDIDGTIRDENDEVGTLGQILSSTVTGVDWIDVSSIGVGGSGTTGYLPLWSAGDTLDNSSIFETGGNIGIGTTTPQGLLHLGIGNTAPLFVSSVGNVGIGTTDPNYRFSIASTDGSDQVSFYHNNTNAYFTTNDGEFTFTSDEVDANAALRLTPNGNGDSVINLEETSSGVTLSIMSAVGSGMIRTNSGVLHLQDTASGNVRLFGSSTEGQTQEFRVYGYRTGDALRSLEINVGADAADTASFDGVSNYLFDGDIQATQATLTNLVLGGIVYDKDSQAGNAGQVLSSTGTGIDWIDISATSGIGGSGTSGYITMWSASDTLTDSSIFESSGNIGIGITNPGYKLEVAGNIYGTTFTDGTITITSGSLTGASSITTSTLVTSALTMATGASDGYVLGSDASGNASWLNPTTMNVGTLSDLVVSQFLRSDINDNFTSGILTFDNGTELNLLAGSTLDIDGELEIADTDILFNGGSTNLNSSGNFSINTDNFFIEQSSGNIGIGTTDPNAILDIDGNIAFTGSLDHTISIDPLGLGNGQESLTIKPGDGNQSVNPTGGNITIEAGGGDGLGSSGGNTYIKGGSGSWGGDVYIQGGSGDSNQYGNIFISPSLKANSGRYIGIGTTNPNAPFHMKITPFMGGSAFDAFIIKETGNVGIASSSPQAKLDLAGTAWLRGNSANQGLFVTTNGFVGIGTTIPSTTLDVNGGLSASNLTLNDIVLSDTTAADSSGAYLIGTFDEFTYSDSTTVQAVLADIDAQIGSLSGGSITGSGTAGYISRWSAPANIVNSSLFESSGNIGIGTTTPSTKLHVVGGITTQTLTDGTLTILGGNLTGANNLVSGNATLTDLIATTISTSTLTTSALTMATGASNGYVLNSDAFGNASWLNPITLNVGTLSDLVVGQFLRSDASDNYTTGTLTFDAGTTLDIDGDINIADTSINFDGASTTFNATGNLAINANHIFVEKSSGNIGISHGSPSEKLHVQGNQLLNGFLRFGNYGTDYSSNTSYPAIYSTSGVGSTYPFNNYGNLVIQSRPVADRDILFITGASANPGIRMTISGVNGFVGIGTTSPTQALEVNGNILATNATLSELRLPSSDNLILNNIALSATTNSTTSGAYLIGIFDEFDNSDNTNVQAVLNDLDTQISNLSSGDSGLWLDSGTTTYLQSTTDDLALGGLDSSSPFFFDTSANLLTLTNTTTGNSFVVNDQASDTTPFLIDENGNVGIGTTDPTASLELNVATASQDGILLKTTDNDTTNNLIEWQTSTGSFRGAISPTGDLGLGVAPDSNTRILMQETNADPSATTQGIRNTLINTYSSNSSQQARANANYLYLQTDTGVTASGVQATYHGSLYIDNANDGAISSAYGNFFYTGIETGAAGSVTNMSLYNAGVYTSGANTVDFTNWRGFNVDAMNAAAFNGATIDNFTGFEVGALTAGTTNIGFKGLLTSGINNYNLYMSGNAKSYFAGNIGIGITDPSASLHISTTAAQDLFRIDDNGYGDTSPFIINYDGNVGIGTTAPGYELEVNGDIALTGSSAKKFVITDNTSNGFSSIAGFSDGLAFSSYITADSSPQMLLKSGGNLGIGTTDPTNKLHIKTSENRPLLVESTDSISRIAIVDGDTTSEAYVGIGALADNLTFYSGQLNHMILDDNGNLGIGTTTPTAQLHLNIGSTASVGQIIQAASGATADLTQWQDSSGSNLAEIDAGGNFGIGASVDTGYKLTVEQTADQTAARRGVKGIVNYTGTSDLASDNRYYGGYFAANLYGSYDLDTGWKTAAGLNASTTYNLTGATTIKESAAIIADLVLGATNDATLSDYSGFKIDGYGAAGHTTQFDDLKWLVVGGFNDLGTATIDTQRGLRVQSMHDADTNYAIDIGTQTTTGTNNIGLYINNITGATNNYAIYTNTGDIRFGDSVDLDSTLLDINDEVGSNGQILSSTGSGVDWVDIDSLGVGGSGTAGYLSLWSDANNLSDASIYESANNVGIGGTNPDTNPTIYISANGNVGIGATDPGAKLDISKINTDNAKAINLAVSADTDGDDTYGLYNSIDTGTGTLSSAYRRAYGIYQDLSNTAIVGSSQYPFAYGITNNFNDLSGNGFTYGFNNNVYTGSTLSHNFYGFNNYVNPATSTANAKIYGVNNQLYMETGTGGSEIYGIYNDLLASITGNQTLYGVLNNMRTQSGDVAYANYVSNGWGLSTGGTHYGLYINLNDADTTNWGIYETGGATNYFAGNVGIGTTAPSDNLEIIGGITTQTLTDGTLNILGGNLTGASNITTSTLTTSALTMGIGASDGYVLGSDASGNASWLNPTTLNVGTLSDLVVTQFLRSDTSDNFTSGTLTFNASTELNLASSSILDIDGDLEIADTDITYNGASTNFTTTGNFSINTNNLFIKQSDGNIGIGTTVPTAQLHLAIGSTATVGQKITLASGATANAFEINSNSGGSGDLFLINSNGNVGIGTTSASTLLHLVGTTEQLRIGYDNSNYTSFTTDSEGILTMADSGTDIATFDENQVNFNVPTTFSAAGDVSMAYNLIMTNQTASKIESYGPLTIETGESWENNDLTLSTYGTGNVIANLGGTGSMQLVGTDTSLIFDTSLSGNTDYWMGIIDNGNTLDDDILVIGDGSTPGSNSFLTIDTSGNVGVGTTDPGYELEVVGSILGTDYYSGDGTQGATTTVSGLVFKDGLYTSGSISAGTGDVSGSGTAGYLSLWSDTNTLTDSSLYETSGNVGIGTTDPKATLEVSSGLDIPAVIADFEIRAQNPNNHNQYTYLNYDYTNNRARLGAWETAVGSKAIMIESTTFYLNNSTNSYISSENIVLDGTGDNLFSGNVGIGSTAATSQALDVAGNIELNEYLYFNNAATEYLRWNSSYFELSDDLLPSANDTYALGATSSRWSDLYLGPNTLHIGTGDADEGEISYLTGNNILSLQSDGNIALQANSGNVGIGNTAPESQFHFGMTGIDDAWTLADAGDLDSSFFKITKTIDDWQTGVDDDTTLVEINAIYDASENSSEQGNALTLTSGTLATNSYNVGTIAGIENYAYHRGSGTVGSIYGIWNEAKSIDSGDVTTMLGIYSRASVKGSANVTTMYGGYSKTDFYSGYTGEVDTSIAQYATTDLDGGTLSDMYLFKGTTSGSTTDVTNAYGLHLSDLPGDNSWAIYSAGSDDFNYFAGNIGIGTVGPTEKLEVDTGNLSIISNGVSNDYGIEFKANDESSRFQIIANLETVTSNDLLLFQEEGNDVLSILGSGYVGIGTTDPTYKLDVVGDAGFDEYIYHNDDVNTYLRFQDDSYSFTAGAETLFRISEATNDFVQIGDGGDVDIYLSGGAVDTLFIEGSSGNIGIGNSNPSSFKLELTGSIGPSTDDTYDLGSPTNRWQDVYVGPSSIHIGTSANEAIITYDTSNNYIAFDPDGDGGTPEFVVDDSGNVGIGTATTGSYNLNISGTANISGNITTSGTVDGVDIAALSSADSSDWDAIGDVPTAAPTNGDTSNLSTADQIYDFVIGLSYITDDTSVPKNHLTNSGTLSFDWADSEIADTLTIGSSSSVNSLALTDGGTISFDWVDAEIADALTISSSGSVASTALTDGGTISFDWIDGEIADDLTITSTKALSALTLNTGSGAMELGDAAVANGDSNSIPTGDQVYDFVIGRGYVTTSDDTVSESELDDAFAGNGTGYVFFNDSTDQVYVAGVAKNYLSDSAALTFDWDDTEIEDDLTINSTKTITTTGNVGIGTTAPSYALHVLDSRTYSAMYMANTNSTDSSNNNVISLGTGAATGTTNARFIKFLGGATTSSAGTAVGNIHINNNAVAYTTSGGDFAEYVPVGESVQPGDLITQTSSEYVKAKTGDVPVGIISDQAGWIGRGHREDDPNYAILGLLGQVTAKVTTLDGNLSQNDPISSSILPGIATKSNSAGSIVGRSQQSTTSWNNSTCTTVTSFNSIDWPRDYHNLTCFKILVSSLDSTTKSHILTNYNLTDSDYIYIGEVDVLLQPSYSDPDTLLTSTGDINLDSETYSGLLATATPSQLENLSSTLTDAAGNTINRIGAFSTIFASGLKASYLDAKNAVIDTLLVRRARVGEELIVGDTNITDELASLQDQIDNFEGNVGIGYESTTSASIENLSSNQIITENIESTGSASFADLTLENIQGATATLSDLTVLSDATISGKLETDSIRTRLLEAESVRAESIEGLEARIGDILAATISAQTMNIKSDPEPIGDLTNLDELTARLDVLEEATNSGSWSVTTNLNIDSQLATDILAADTGMFSSFLSVEGQAIITDLSITNGITIQNTLAITDNSISVLDGVNNTLYLQPDGIGKVDILAGAVTIDSSGNLSVDGDLYLAGTLYANDIVTNSLEAAEATISGSLFADIVKPTNDDIAIQLEADQLATQSGQFKIADQNDSVVASIDASGSASLRKVMIADAKEATTSGVIGTPTQPTVTSNATAGTAILPADTTQLTIQNPNVTKGSLVYITPASDTGNNVLYVKNKIEKDSNNPGSFTVTINTPNSSDIEFNWWIIN